MTIRIVALLLLLNLLPATAAAGPIYVYKENGIIRFSSKKPPAGVKATVFKHGQQAVSFYRGPSRGAQGGLFKTSYSPYIRNASLKYRVDPALIRAVIHAESHFNPKAVSPKGAKGLMQLMDATTKRVGVSNVFSPAQNIDGGVRLLAILLKKYKGNKKLALAAYNAGEGAVAKYGGIPPFKETKEYVKKVLYLAARYKNALNERSR